MPIITWLLFIHFLRCVCNPSSKLWTHSKCSNFYHLVEFLVSNSWIIQNNQLFTSSFKNVSNKFWKKHPPFPKCMHAPWCLNGITPFLPLWVWKGFFDCYANPPKVMIICHFHFSPNVIFGLCSLDSPKTFTLSHWTFVMVIVPHHVGFQSLFVSKNRDLVFNVFQ